MIANKIFLSVASIIKAFFIFIFFTLNSYSNEDNIKFFSNDKGVLSIMYHRFNENKYPSTNIKMEIFIKQMNMINDKKYKFIYPDEFDKKFLTKKDSKKILITIDDAYSSFFVKR